MTLSRRSLITGLVSFVAAPAIVRASSLMPVKAYEIPVEEIFWRVFEVLRNNELSDEDRYVFDPQRDLFIPV
jgi:hypothetical protein